MGFVITLFVVMLIIACISDYFCPVNEKPLCFSNSCLGKEKNKKVFYNRDGVFTTPESGNIGFEPRIQQNSNTLPSRQEIHCIYHPGGFTSPLHESQKVEGLNQTTRTKF